MLDKRRRRLATEGDKPVGCPLRRRRERTINIVGMNTASSLPDPLVPSTVYFGSISILSVNGYLGTWSMLTFIRLLVSPPSTPIDVP